MDKKYSISIILPVYNEEGNIEKTVQDTCNFLQGQSIFKEFEIVIVDDGSRDNTARIVGRLTNETSCLKAISHHKNLGYGKALMSGVQNSQYPLVFFMDSDGQFKINQIKDMMNYIFDCDVITGYRYKRKDPFYRIIISKIYTLVVSLLFELRFKDVNCGFKLFRKEVISDNYRFDGGIFYTEVLLKAKKKGFKIKEVPVKHFPRLKGKQTGGSLKVISKAIIDITKLIVFVKYRIS